ncbi:MAG: glycoside hydrolase family 2 TIM barrel-domain containing protein [Prolixibacteraceae bacterium]|jgi:beta-galactosidase|nr:glycoside hydrolase family 2 TIM barrel-domain containing protein [Prolixibacteraceae bacterium]
MRIECKKPGADGAKKFHSALVFVRENEPWIKTMSNVVFVMFFALIALLGFSGFSFAGENKTSPDDATLPGNRKILFDDGWKFHKGDISLGDQIYWGWLKTGTCNQSGARSRLDDKNWRDVDLPHDFAIEGHLVPSHGVGVDHGVPEMWSIGELPTNRGFLPGDVAWYRKRFKVGQEDKGKRIYLQFDGVFRDCRVFLNDFFVGDNLSGYAPFYFDVTDFIEYGGENVLAVKVDAREPEGWFYEGAGIYRHVWMIKTDALHIQPWGIFVSSDVNPEKKSAKVSVATDLVNRYGEAKSVKLITKITDPDGNIVGRSENTADIGNWDKKTLTREIAINHARLWSLQTPDLYTANVSVWVDGKVVDTDEVTFGIRKIEYTVDNGFLLNGRPVKMKGACVHQDYAGVGVAVPNSIMEYKIRKLKEFGVNAYRTSHHPPAPEILEICDRLGMLVMCENRMASSSNEDLSQLERMIKMGRNHPSVVLWSLGNEEERVEETKQGAMIVRTMRETVKKLDPTRPVTMGMKLWGWMVQKERPVDVIINTSDEIEVMGFNYGDSGWLEYHEKRPAKPVVATEASSCLRTRACYEDNPDRCQVSEVSGQEWIRNLSKAAEKEMKLTFESPWMCGIFIWTGFDYHGEPNPFYWPATVSQFGILDLTGQPKDNAWYYKSWWSDEPVVHASRNWTLKHKPGEKLNIYVYSNCDEVELFRGDKSLGKKSMPRYGHLEWTGVDYMPETLRAVGYTDGKIAEKDLVKPAGNPVALKLIADRTTAKADGRDAVVIDVAIVDDNNNPVLWACNDVSFKISGNARILGVSNGDPMRHESEKSNVMRAFNGYCQIIIESDGKKGKAEVTAVSPGLRTGAAVIGFE